MPRQVRKTKTVAFTVRLAPDVVEMIERLAGSLYGLNRADVARTLIHDQLKQANVQAMLDKMSKP